MAERMNVFKKKILNNEIEVNVEKYMGENVTRDRAVELYIENTLFLSNPNVLFPLPPSFIFLLFFYYRLLK